MAYDRNRIVVVYMSSILSQMYRYLMRTRSMAYTHRLKRIRIVDSARLSQNGYMVYIDSQCDAFSLHGLIGLLSIDTFGYMGLYPDSPTQYIGWRA